MADQSRRRQPSRFWLPPWSKPTPTTPRPPPATPRPAAPRGTSIPPPIQAQPKPLSPSRSPAATRPQSPSPSPSAAQAAIQQPAEPPQMDSVKQSSTPTGSTSPSPSRGDSKTQLPAATDQEESRPTALAIESFKQPESPSKVHVEPQESEPPVAEALPQDQTLQPQAQLQTGLQAQDQTLPQQVPQPNGAGEESPQPLEPKPESADPVTSESAPSQSLISDRKPDRTHEDESITSLQAKQDMQPPQIPPEEEKPQADPGSEQSAQPLQLPKAEEEPRTSEEKAKESITREPDETEPGVQQNTILTRPELEITSEGSKDKEGKLTSMPETQDSSKHSLSELSEESKNRTGLKLSTSEPESKPEKLFPDASGLLAKIRNLGKQEDANGHKGSKDSKSVLTSVPRAPLPHGTRASFHNEIKDGISKLIQKLNVGQPEHQENGHALSIITLAGENKGASMHIGHATATKQGSLHKGQKVDPDEVDEDNSGAENPAMTVTVNSNVQSINNSVLQDSSCSEENPGVQLILSGKPEEQIQLKERKKPVETSKCVLSATQPQKLRYNPIISRCARELSLDFSERNEEGRQKPQCNSCPYNGRDKIKGKVDPDANLQY